MDEPYGRGRIAPSQEVLDARHAAAFKRHRRRMRALPAVTLASYDLRTLGCVPPIKNQASCGSCWDFSGTDTCEIAMMRAGMLPVDGGGLAVQYGMDCHNWGGCGGGDEVNVIEWCKSNGLPLMTDYGPYKGGSQVCHLKPTVKMWKINDWGYCHSDQGQGIASVQEIKNAIIAHGPISVAVDASAFNAYTGGVMRGRGHNIDHAVMLIGWVDDPSLPEGGFWIVRNQWSAQWGEQGYAKIAYGAFDIGTEAIWVAVTPLVPVPPMDPFEMLVTNASPAGLVTITVTLSSPLDPGLYVVTHRDPLPPA